ncbi:hypothetical protein AVEN_139747-1 [Araneus ventricosus]|uniref:Integrase catalytic domain-containing protein n=1 Tax=Araneus ventricosus TaxID=182803 RepID=A0A4Y2WC96_ARAVE|nr:hypothetical protein AVEN_139747-1 [Araneus ventricosus]
MIMDSYPLTTIDGTLDALNGSQWFSTLDLKSGCRKTSNPEDGKKDSHHRQGLWHGPLPVTTKGKSVCTGIDYFTKRPGDPIPDQETSTVLKNLFEHGLQHGVPMILLFDQGTNFGSALFTEPANFENSEDLNDGVNLSPYIA